MIVTPNISIYIPVAGDTNYEQSFAAGLVNIDQHDHSGAPNKGVPLGSGAIGPGAISYTQLNTNVVDPTTGIGTSGITPNQIILLGYLANLYVLSQVPNTGIVSMDGSTAYAVTLTGTPNQVAVANGDGTGADPTFSLSPIVTNTTQPAFSASITPGSQSNKTGNGAVWLVRFATVQYDQGSNFTVGSDPTGSYFTAPAGGIYLFTVDLNMLYTTPTGLNEVQLEIVSSSSYLPGGANTMLDFNPYPVTNPSQRTIINASQILQLATNDTVQIRVTAFGMAGNTASISGGFFTGAKLW